MEIALIAGSSALLTIAVIVGLIMLALKLSDAKDAAASSAVRAMQLDGQLAIAAAALATKANEANSERTRANALDDALGKAEQELESDPRGALDRLLAHWRASVPNVPTAATGSAAVSDPSGVHPPSAPAGSADGRDRLLTPGE